MNKGFKGVWIEKQIWDYSDLNITNRCFLAEIDNLNKGPGCFAKNKHFSKWSGLSLSRCSEIINYLFDNNYIDIEKKENNKRFLSVNFNSLLQKTPSESRQLPSESRQLPSESRQPNNNVIEKQLEKQESESAHAFLKIKFPNKLNIWEMQNKKLIENYNKFILDFDDKMIIEKMEYDQNILFARLRIYGRSWIENNKKNKVFPINQDLPKKHPSLKRLTY